MSYTKGPWKAEMYPKGIEQRESYEIFAEDAAGTYITGVNEDNPQHKENAQLIATAPELLDSLEEIVSICEDAPRGMGDAEQDILTIQNIAESAIKKAKGGNE